MDAVDPSVDVFNQDIAANAGYLYTTNARLGSRLAIQRQCDVLIALNRFAGRSVLDLGCGDGTCTRYLWDHAKPRAMLGIDAAAQAVAVANDRRGDRVIRFEVGDARGLPYPDGSYDIALMQGMLHHDDTPWAIIREAFRLAAEIVVLEPNGYNLGLKVIERTSPYHRAHHERSYAPSRLHRWVEQAGGRVVEQRYAGLVPEFCPDWVASTLKSLEPVVEGLPWLNRAGCGIHVFVATRNP